MDHPAVLIRARWGSIFPSSSGWGDGGCVGGGGVGGEERKHDDRAERTGGSGDAASGVQPGQEPGVGAAEEVADGGGGEPRSGWRR